MASTYTSLPAVSLGNVTLGAVDINAGTNHIGSVTLDTEGGATGASVPANAVYAGGTDGTNLRGIAVTSTGLVKILGASATGAAVPTSGVMVGGTDGTNLRAIAVNSSGSVVILGEHTAGSAITSAGIAVGGNDGTNFRTIKTTTAGLVQTDPTSLFTVGAAVNTHGMPVLLQDVGTGFYTTALGSNGDLIIFGANQAASALPGGGVQILVSDGTNSQYAKSDTSGRQIVIGQATPAAAIPTSGLFPVSGSDGTNARALSTNTSGQLIMAGVGAAGAATPGAILTVGGSDGTNLRAISVAATGFVNISGVGATGSTVPAAAMTVGGTDGTNLRAVSVSSTGVVNVSTGSDTKVISGTFTRPADTTTYAIAESVSDSTSSPTQISFANAARSSGGGGVILYAKMVKTTTGTTGASFRLWLYGAAATAYNDNAAFQIDVADADARIGYIDFVPSTEGAGSDCMEAYVSSINMTYNIASGTTMFGQLETKGAYVPGNAEQFKFYLGCLRD